jgi:transcriptional regulator with XRE-family HTH domain
METFGERVLRELSRMGRTQSFLVRQAGFTQSTVNDLIHGKRRPALDQALSIASVLGVSVDYLAGNDHSVPLTPAEVQALKLVRSLKLDEEEVIRRLAASPARQDATPDLVGRQLDPTTSETAGETRRGKRTG